MGDYASRMTPASKRGASAGRQRFALSVIASIGLVAAAGAQEVSPPVPLEQAQPEMPTNQFGGPIEGWVKVRYVVLADGTTSEVRIIEAMPPSLPTRRLASVVEGWKFTPAEAAGQPIDWHNNESVIVFDADDVPLEPSPFFAQSYVEIIELIGEQQFEQALRQNEQLLHTRAQRLNEIGLAQAQAAIVNVALENLQDAYEAILRATDPRVPTLQDAELADALRYRFLLALELGHYADSLETRERLEALGALLEEDPVIAQADAISEALKSDAAILVKGRVQREPWSYTPTRRTFTFAEIEGSVRNIELECDRRKAVLDFSPEAEWSIPESWGACTLFVNARRNTTFSLVEFP